MVVANRLPVTPIHDKDGNWDLQVLASNSLQCRARVSS